MECLIKNLEGQEICNTLNSPNCLKCFESIEEMEINKITCPIDNTSKRQTQICTNTTKCLICDSSAKNTKNFKSDAQLVAMSSKRLIPIAVEMSSSIAHKNEKRIDRLLHNLRGINAHYIQELQKLLPAQVSKKSVREAIPEVIELIKKKPKDAAGTLMRISKLNTSLKAEFTIYDMLITGRTKPSFSKHKLRDIVMLVLHPFFADFSAKNIYVDIEECYDYVYVDFESFHVALYHILENATKYSHKNNNIQIRFSKTEDAIMIIFAMESHFLDKEDITNIFNDGYSGKYARKSEKNGKGLGMYRAKQLLELNNISIEFMPGQAKYTENGIQYADNEIVLTLPLNSSHS